MAKATRRRLGEAAWRGLLADQVRSGLSVAQFCSREGVSAASFYQWRSRLGRGDLGVRSDPVTAPMMREGSAPAFVDLGTLGGGGRFELRLDLGGGLVLQLARG
jgi:transposase-like protein